MSAFFASYRNECEKLLRRKKYIVFLFIGLAVCAVWTLLGRILTDFIRMQSGYFFVFTPTPMGALPFFLQIFVPFLMFMAATDLITVEGAENTMKAAMCRPVERWKLYASKILAVETYAAAYLGCIFVICALLTQTLGKALAINELLTAFASYALTLIPLLILACFAALVALFGRSGTLVMFLLILFYIALNALPVFFPVLTEMLFTSYLGWHRLWIGALPGASKLLHMLVIVLGYGTVFFTAGSLLFDRKDY
ncbi:MAG: ABC transporter permease [Oscillospiraceae bacterium]|nr:ABC transporter permease [Oscillospiraceae bacterium]